MVHRKAVSFMDLIHSKRFLISFLCFLVAMAGGCTDMGQLPAWMPFQKQSDSDQLGIVSPAERMAELKKLAKEAGRADAAQQQRVLAELARQFDAEEDPLIRAEIVRTVGEYRGGEADAVLRLALEDLDAEVRMASCVAWGKREGSESATLLGRALGGDIDIDVRLAASRALSHSKDPAAMKALGLALEDKDPAMQISAARSLHTLTGKDFGYDVNRWRQYVKGELPQSEKPLSIADRFRQMF